MISGRDNTAQYVKGIGSIIAQDLPDVKLVVSGCMMSEEVKRKIIGAFGNLASYIWLDEPVPVNVSFNLAAMVSVREFGAADAIAYYDSGLHYVDRTHLRLLYELMMSGPFGIVAARTDDDTGFHQNLGIGDGIDDFAAEERAFAEGPYVIPVGGCCNLHHQLYSWKFFEAYNGRLLCDIFAGYCSESVYSFCCAAIKQKYVIHDKVVMHHAPSVDGQSSGFHPSHHVAKGGKTYDHAFRSTESIVDICKRGYQFGMGYEESQKVLMHDATHFDKYGFCKNDQLKDFIRDNLNLDASLLDYEKLKYEVVL